MALVPMQSPTISPKSGFHLSVWRFSAHPPAPCGRSLLRISDERPEPPPVFQSPRTPPDKLPAEKYEVPDLKARFQCQNLCSTSTTLIPAMDAPITTAWRTFFCFRRSLKRMESSTVRIRKASSGSSPFTRRCKRTRTSRDQNPVILLCLLLRFHQMLFCMYPDDRLLNQVKRYLLPDLIQISKRKQAVKLQLSKRIVGCHIGLYGARLVLLLYIDLPLLITGADRFNRMITCRAESYHSIVHVFPPLKYRKATEIQ